MTEQKVLTNPDLQKERDAGNFNVEELSIILHDGKENLDKKRELENLIYTDKDYMSIPLHFMSREEQYEEGLRRSSLAVLKKDSFGDIVSRPSDLHQYNSRIMPVNVLFDLNYGMFAPTILNQGTPEQQEKYLFPALNHEIIGTYAQTEMGHGTFLRGLETTAHYDPNTQEFVLNTPTVTSTKWWPGALGKTSTHAVVLAQLYTQGKCHGIHPFIVQLRSLEDHKSLPGIEVGDIGPKFGFAANDNGYLRLNNVRIPREDMLSKYSQVASDGTYTKPPKSKLTYGTMTLVRAFIVKNCAYWLARCCTIAVRYSAVRRQSEIRPGEPEPQVLTYQTQQHKLFPLLATAYAFLFVQESMTKTYNEVNAEVNAGLYGRTQELHALSSGLKAFTSNTANFGAEVLRMSCGGHGYSQASGFPSLYVDSTPTCTYEGENTVLLLQTARYLVKCMREKLDTYPESVQYLQKPPINPTNRNLEDLNFLKNAYSLRAYGLVKFASDKVESSIKNGSDLIGALNEHAVYLVRAANAHSHLFVVDNFVNKLKSLQSVSEPTKAVLTQLAKLYVYEGISQDSGQFLEDGILSSKEVHKIRQKAINLLPIIRRNAVCLVDAFDFHDRYLQSILGRYDGNVYENLLKWAQSSPLNKTDVHESYEKYLKPLLQRNKSKL